MQMKHHTRPTEQDDLLRPHLVDLIDLRDELVKMTALIGHSLDLAAVDRGYQGHDALKTRVLISGTRRGPTPKRVADLRRRSAIEAEIGDMKTDGRLSRSPLKGIIGDALFATLCGHNIRKILAYLRALLALMFAVLLSALCAKEPTQ
jgi:IS5 family transposase